MTSEKDFPIIDLLDGKIEAIDTRFRKGSKRYKAARYIIRQNRKITSKEREKICDEIPIAPSTLADLFTELRKMGIYPPKKTPELLNETLNTEIPQNPVPHTQEETPLQDYATLDDLNDLKNSLSNDIRYLASVIGGEPTSNPSNYEEKEEMEVDQPQEVELIPPEEGFIRDPSLTTKQIHIKPKTWMYFDMSRQGVFSNYADSREMGPFTDFNGDISDFFNILADDYFVRNYNADIGLIMRRYVR